MTRSDVMASSRPSTVSGERARKGSSGIWRGLTVVAVLLALALLPSVALGASEPTSGYKQTPTVGKTTPSSGVAPSKEEKTTPKETAPASESTAPAAEKATTLPFTGFDLRWDIGLGLLLIAAGVSIVVLQRRQRRERQL
jgi:hypothetical protein